MRVCSRVAAALHSRMCWTSSRRLTKKEREKQEKRDKEKAERIADAAKPLNKVAKAANIAQTELGKCSAWLDEVNQSKVNADTKKIFRDKFQKHVTDIKKLKNDCLTCEDEQKAIDLLAKQPTMQEALKKDIASWKKIKKSFGKFA